MVPADHPVNGQVFTKAPPTGPADIRVTFTRWNDQYLSCQPVPDQLLPSLTADMAQMVRHAETPARPKRLVATDPVIEPDDTEPSDPQVVTVTPTNRAVFFQGRKIGLPINYANRQLYRTVTADELAYWCVVEGDMVLSIPLPIVAITGSKQFVNSYNIQGVWLQDPPPLWIKRREQALQKFQALTSAETSGISQIVAAHEVPTLRVCMVMTSSVHKVLTLRVLNLLTPRVLKVLTLHTRSSDPRYWKRVPNIRHLSLPR